MFELFAVAGYVACALLECCVVGGVLLAAGEAFHEQVGVVQFAGDELAGCFDAPVVVFGFAVLLAL